jgi:hypothetical protein
MVLALLALEEPTLGSDLLFDQQHLASEYYLLDLVLAYLS